VLDAYPNDSNVPDAYVFEMNCEVALLAVERSCPEMFVI
jgi:hypothetical protein